MNSRLQFNVRNLSLVMHHLVNAYEVEAGIGVIAGNTAVCDPCLSALSVRYYKKVRYINTLTLYLYHNSFFSPSSLHTSVI